MRWLVVAVVSLGCGDSRSPAADGSSDVSSDTTTCATTACADDGDACTLEVCSEVDGCRHVAVDRCAEPSCGLGACAGVDTDGDGLSDAWETQGYIDVNCNGQNDGDGIDVQLADADPNVPDVYIEIDYLEMPGSGMACTNDTAGDAICNGNVPGEQCIAGVCTHSHKPRQASLDMVRLTAARGLPPLPGDPAPPADLAGKPGFRIHWDLAHSNAIPETTAGGPEVVSFGTTDSRTLDPNCVGPNARNYFDLKEANFYNTLASNAPFYAARRRVYHYAIAAHYSECPPDVGGGNNFCDACGTDRGGGNPQAGSSGSSEIPGNDFMISLADRFFSLGRPITILPREEAGTILHELGHNFGLMHGVDLLAGVRVPAFAPEYSPTYFSVMNYNYQFGTLYAAAPGNPIPSSIRLDYADDTVCTDLVESALVESDGAGCGATTPRVMRYVPGTGVSVFGSATTGTAVDWDNANGISTTPMPVDLNSINGANETYYTINEWENVTGRFTHMAFDSFCSMWTVEDGLAPPQALVLAEPGTRAAIAHRSFAPIVNVAATAAMHRTDVAVTIYGSHDLDATKISIPTVRLAGHTATRGTIRDLNGDGIEDLRVQIPMLHPLRASSAIVQGTLLDHTDFVTSVALAPP